jgi:hypothetical protein
MSVLGKRKIGLPRYSMDCGWWRSRKFAGMSAQALLVFQAAVGYGNEHATDGVVPAGVDGLSLSLGLKRSWVKKAVPELLESGAFVRIDAKSLQVANFLEHNASREQIESESKVKQDGAIFGNHKRWHSVTPAADCIHCEQGKQTSGPPKKRQSSDRSTDPSTDNGATPKVLQGTEVHSTYGLEAGSAVGALDGAPRFALAKDEERYQVFVDEVNVVLAESDLLRRDSNGEDFSHLGDDILATIAGENRAKVEPYCYIVAACKNNLALVDSYQAPQLKLVADLVEAMSDDKASLSHWKRAGLKDPGGVL